MTLRDNDMLQRYIHGELSPQERIQAILPDADDSCELLVACPPGDYSASALSRGVEDCDARVLAMAVTSMTDAAGRPVVMIRANTRTPEGIARSLARYGYEVLHTIGGISPHEQTRAMARVNELLHYLEI